MRGRQGRRGGRAFTLVEMLVILAIIVVLISLLFPTLSTAWEQARQTSCMSNLRQITTAYLHYAADHDGALVDCDGAGEQVGAPPAGSQGQSIPALVPYSSGDARIYHCPVDDRVGWRSYSINDYLGGTWPGDNYEHVFNLANVANCAHTFLFIEEMLPIQPDPKTGETKQSKTGGFVVMPYPNDVWIDVPAVAHNRRRGTCLSFVDGHCEYWAWSDLRTRDLAPPPGYPHTKASPDLVRLQSAEGFGHAPPR